MSKPRAYLRNWSLYIRGFRWLWTRNAPPTVGQGQGFLGIVYKPHFGPWRFLPVYLSTYLVGTLCGFGVVSISKVLWERSELYEWDRKRDGVKYRHPLSRFLGRLIDWLFEKVLRQGPNHCAGAGPRLWGSRSVWESTKEN